MEEVACQFLCEGGDDAIIVARDRLHDFEGRFSVVRCRCCGLMRTTPRPTAHEIGRFYPADYSPYKIVQKSEGRDSFLRRVAQMLIDFRSEAVPTMRPGRLLEIGCASGNFLQKMKNIGWQVHGVEFAESAAEAARSRGFTVSTCRVEDMPAELTGFDLTVGWMVIEHLHEPLAALTDIFNRTAPGGKIALSVPNAQSWGRKTFGENWFALQTPTHLFHFTPTTIRLLMERAGWEVESIRCQRIISDIPASLGNWLADRFPHSEWLQRLRWSWRDAGLMFNLLAYPFAVILAAIGQTDRMTIHAHKKS